jgi:hypothetical protein
LTFTTGAGAKVVLINGASSENVGWLQVQLLWLRHRLASGNLIANPGAVSMGLVVN